MNTVEKFYGYSKREDKPEPMEKSYLLERLIHNILSKYREKMLYIEVFKRVDTRSEWTGADKILSLYCNDYELTPHGLSQVTPLTHKYLDQIYQRLRSSKSFDDLKPHHKIPGAAHSYEDYLKAVLSKGAIKTVDELKIFCRNEVNGGREKGVLEHFFYLYKQKYL